MDEKGTKPLIPAWVVKLAEAVKKEYEVWIPVEKGLSTAIAPTEELAAFMWKQIVKDIIPTNLPSADTEGSSNELS